MQAIDRLLEATFVDGSTFVDDVVVVLCMDKRDPSYASSELLANMLANHYDQNRRVTVHELPHGDIYVAAGNHGLALALARHAEWGLTMSPEAVSYLTQGVIDSFDNTMNDKRCHAVGVALKEVEDTVREGRLTGTLAAWRLETFFSAGGFPMAAARRPPGWETPTIEFDGNAMKLHGVEEVPLLIGMAVMLEGPFIRIIPADGGEYQTAADAWRDDRAWAEEKKFDSKRLRQDAHAQRGFGFPDAGILRDYIIR